MSNFVDLFYESLYAAFFNSPVLIAFFFFIIIAFVAFKLRVPLIPSLFIALIAVGVIGGLLADFMVINALLVIFAGVLLGYALLTLGRWGV